MEKQILKIPTSIFLTVTNFQSFALSSLNLKRKDSNNPRVNIICSNIIDQTYYIFPLNN